MYKGRPSSGPIAAMTSWRYQAVFHQQLNRILSGAHAHVIDAIAMIEILIAHSSQRSQQTVFGVGEIGHFTLLC